MAGPPPPVQPARRKPAHRKHRTPGMAVRIDRAPKPIHVRYD
jgi:hypothetical protein